MGDLSKRLSRYEVACKCGCGFATADIELVNALEACADHFAQQLSLASRIIIHINSWCRCPVHNRHEKGHRTSEHLEGTAADFWLEGEDESGKRFKIDDKFIHAYLIAAYPDRYGIGRYHGRTHLDVRTNGPSRWDKT